MPELPDVEVYKRYADSTALHHKIKEVDVRSTRILEGITAKELASQLEGRSLESTQRYGKYLFFGLNDNQWLVMHFGMTGDLKYYKVEEKEPEYTQLLIGFENDYNLAYDAPRKLGEIDLVKSVQDFISKKGLGPDVMAAGFDFETFKNVLSGRRAMIKSALMNQEIMAGIGNVYSDEILFQARVYPKAKVNELDEKTLKNIFDEMKKVLETTIDRQANPDEFPGSYLIPHRDQGEKCPRCDGEVEKIEVSGRSGYYCPSCQGK